MLAVDSTKWNRAKRLLCVRLDSIGDVLMTTPAIRALKEGGADREITLLTSASGASVAKLIPQIDEVLVCSIQGDVLYEWQCRDANKRVRFLEFVSQKARQLGQGLPLGEFERLEIQGTDSRVLAQIQKDRAMLVRSSQAATEGPR